MVANKKPTFGGVRTGGRSALVVDQVLTTTVELLGESGYSALRFDEVAERSGVNKTTIYRRWPTKPQLVTAALRCFKFHAPAQDTGDLERDLTDMFVASLSQVDIGLTRGLMRMSLVENRDPELDAIRQELREQSIALRKPRFDLAVTRGELPPKADTRLLLTMISSAIYLRMLAHGEVSNREAIADIVGITVAGARVRWAKSPKQPKKRKPSKRS